MSVQVLRTESGHLEQLLDEVLANLRGGHREHAVTNLTHAVQVALGVDEDPTLIPGAVKQRLDAILRLGGGVG